VFRCTLVNCGLGPASVGPPILSLRIIYLAGRKN